MDRGRASCFAAGPNLARMSTSILGHAVIRREDPALLRGAARFLADLPADGALYAHFVRSAAAHAVIRGVDVDGARGCPGIVGVFTAGDLELPKLGEFPPPPGGPRAHLGRPCLAEGRVRFVGEPIAVVVAATREAAVDAAELVDVDLDDLGAVVDPLAAMEAGAPLLFADHGSNIVIDHPGAVDGDDVLEGADVIVRGRFRVQRVAPVPVEPGGALAVPGDDGRLTVWVSTQAPFAVRTGICEAIGLAPDRVRIVAPAVGGGFGAKGGAHPEHLVVAALALRLGRPVRWEETRSENMVAMTHGRGQIQDVELGASRDGTLVGMRARTVTDLGAYSWRGGIPTRTSRLMASGVYRIPRIDLHSLGVVTTKTPVGPYRGAGRPEATAMLERAMDLLAAELDMDPVEVRRRNLLTPSDFPYTTPVGASYDSGDYGAALTEALRLAGYEGLRAEQAERRRNSDPIAMGVGISCFCEISGSGPEYGGVSIEPDGSVLVTSGSSPHGQGHETTLAQVAATVVGVPIEAVRVIHSDTAVVARGTGTFGSRSGQLAGSAVFQAGTEVVARARQLAADLLEAAPADVMQTEAGTFSVVGVPSRALSWQDLAVAAGTAGYVGPALAADGDFAQESGTFPFGTHIAVVDIDTETGRVIPRRLVAVDDCGIVVNPMVVAGQLHGGLAQGVGQALLEEIVYDEAGNPLTANLADYGWPGAPDLPVWELGETVTPSPRNPLGMKGIGESGAVGSLAAVQNAVVDALRPWGVTHVDPPFTPQRVWNALRAAPIP